MTKTVKCPRCKKENDRSVAIMIPSGKVNKYYCQECSDEINKSESCGTCGNKTESMYTVQGEKMCVKCYNAHKKAQEETQKCKGCGKHKPKKGYKKYSDGWYCPSCIPKRQKEADWFVKINDFLNLNQGEQYNPILVNSQIKRFREEQGMSVSGIYKTLTYIANIKEISLGKEGIGLVPFYYSEARRFYKRKQTITENALATPKEQWMIEELVYTIREEHSPRLKRPMLNMEDIDID